MKKTRGFSLLELMIVVTLLSVISVFVVPNLLKSVKRQEESVAVMSLQTIRAGLKAYRARYGSYPSTDLIDLTAINTTLGLKLQLGPMASYDYVADAGAGEVNRVTVTAPGSSWTIHFHNDGFLHCDVGPCPSCPDAVGGGCD